jgi:hypothetical protein
MEKQEVIDTLNSILGAVEIHKSFLTSFVSGDGLKLQQIETQNNKVNIHFTSGVWGVNTLGLINTIVSTLVDDSILFITDELTGIIKEAVWESTVTRKSTLGEGE